VNRQRAVAAFGDRRDDERREGAGRAMAIGDRRGVARGQLVEQRHDLVERSCAEPCEVLETFAAHVSDEPDSACGVLRSPDAASPTRRVVDLH
jgi:hypothetical protein